MELRFDETICSWKPWLNKISVVCQRDLFDLRMALYERKGCLKDCGSYIALVITIDQFKEAAYNVDQAPEKRALSLIKEKRSGFPQAPLTGCPQDLAS